MGNNLLEVYFLPVFGEPLQQVPEITELLLIGASVAAGLAGIAVVLVYVANPQIPVNLAVRFKSIYNLLLHKYYVDEFYSWLFVENGGRLAMFLWEFIDVRVIDASANGLARMFGAISRALRAIQTGYARVYALLMLIGTVLLLGWLILR
jgi:NADH-quinone oxidoreductase subunit L